MKWKKKTNKTVRGGYVIAQIKERDFKVQLTGSFVLFSLFFQWIICFVPLLPFSHLKLYLRHTSFSYLIPHFSGLAVCYQRQSVSNNNHNNAEAKPTHAPPSHYPHGHKWNEPYFDLTMPRNITSLVGKSAYLGCRVKHLGNKTVSPGITH